MIDYSLAAPEIFLTIATCVVLVVDVFLRPEQRKVTYWLSMLTLVGAAVVTLWFAESSGVGFHGAYIADSAGQVLKLFAYLFVALVFLYSRDFLESNGLLRGEFFILGLFGLLGLMVIVSAHNLLLLYLGLELHSLSLYALVAFNRKSTAASEAAMKYFVLGAIASGAFLYGISMLYGATGTIQLDVLVDRLSQPGALNVPAVLGLVFIILGIAFKFGAVPFHMWIPDVYQGPPTPVSLYVGTVPEIAAFALAWRMLVGGLDPLYPSWSGMLVVVCVLSLVVGNVLAIAQTNFKRMLAYSAISHVGFVLMGFIAGTPEGLSFAMYYTLAYILMAAAAFGLIILLGRGGFEAENLEDFKGLNARSPWFALMMLLVMFSLAGVPPLVGFAAKLAVLSSIIHVGYVWLAVLGVLCAVIGAFYYLRVVWYMYFAEPTMEHPPALVAPTDMRIVLSANGLSLLVLGIFPSILLGICVRVFA